MEMLRTAVSSLSFSDPAEAAIDRANERRKAALLIAQLPTVVARYHRVRQGLTRLRPTRRSRTPRTSSPCCATSRRRSRRCARSTSR